MKKETQKKSEVENKSAAKNQRSGVQLNDLNAKKGEEIKGGLRRSM